MKPFTIYLTCHIEQTIQVSPCQHQLSNQEDTDKDHTEGKYVCWPLVTAENVSKCIPQSEETMKGYKNHQKQGIISTKPKKHTCATITEYFPKSREDRRRYVL